MSLHTTLPFFAALFLSACVRQSPPAEVEEHRAAALALKEAGKSTTPAEQRAALYLKSAEEAADLLDSPTSGEAARKIHNKAAADLTVLLRDAGHGKMWNRPLTVTSGNSTYHLRFAQGTRDGIWNPDYFTSFTPADEVKLRNVKCENHQEGVGGALVGVRKPHPLDAFSPLVGITAPVTAVIDFKGREATLTLIDPAEKDKFSIAGRQRTPKADYSAPLAYYPQKSELWEGLMGAIRVDKYMKTTGLYMLQPYDPDRIPLIFVHGLISTPRMWRNVINEIETDPTLRGRYQYWVFGYPTGNPPAYSALRFREELEKVRRIYPNSRDYVLVGHSMGGLVSRMQATTVTRDAWDSVGKERSGKLFSRVRKDSLVDRCAIYQANPRIDRVIFICTPHRGSQMAIGSIGELGMRLIALPVDLTASVAGTLGNSLAAVTGDPKRLPNSVTGLSPTNPMLKVLDACPIEPPHHSIIGDRGKGDTPKSSDGVVEYWSSSLRSARSERIVPGPHGACELPETIAELRRLLHLHLQENGSH